MTQLLDTNPRSKEQFSKKDTQPLSRILCVRLVPLNTDGYDQTPIPSAQSLRRFPHVLFSWGLHAIMLFSWLLLIFSLFTGLGLLLDDLAPYLFGGLTHAPISAAPLLLIGASSLCLQIIMRPRPLDLCKALIVSLAFILWGIDQMLPAGWIATMIGDLVIVLYIVDLGWMIGSVLHQRQKARK